MRTLRVPRSERRLAAKHLLGDVAREFSSDLLKIIDEQQDGIFHLLPSDVYFANRQMISNLLVECVIRRASGSLSQISKGKQLLVASRAYVRTQVALRSGSSANALMKGWKPRASLLPSFSQPSPINNSVLDFASRMPGAPGCDLTFWASFARRLCGDVDDVVRTYSFTLRRL
jgi:hypothetical protein